MLVKSQGKSESWTGGGLTASGAGVDRLFKAGRDELGGRKGIEALGRFAGSISAEW